jgi:MFS family permease
MKSLDVRPFRWLLASNLMFFMVMQGQMLTRSFLAWELTNDEMSLAYINAAFALPAIVFSVIGGALVDRFNRRVVAQWAQIFLVAGEAAILLLLLSGQLKFWHMLVAVFTGGMVAPIMMAARTALVYNVVGDALLSNATAMGMSVISVTRVLGPLLSGWVIAVHSVDLAYTLAVAMFLFSLVFLSCIPKKLVRQEKLNEDWQLLDQVKGGVLYLKDNRHIFSCIVFGLMPMTLIIPLQNLLILFTDNVWQVGEAGLGTLMSVAGIGGVVGSLWMASRNENKGRLQLMLNSAMILSICIAAFSVTPNFYWALLPLAIANVFASAIQTLNSTVVQTLVADSHRGRISSFIMMVFGFTPLGTLPLAFLAKHIGIQWSIFSSSHFLLIAIVLFYRLSSSLRTIDDAVVAKRKKTADEQH